MPSSPLLLRRRRVADVLPRRHTRFERRRVALADGASTTLHVASYDLGAVTPRVIRLEQPAPLARWCRTQGIRHAVVGGFFLRPQYAPLGQVRIGGESWPSVPFDPPWGSVRACVHISGRSLRIARRDALAPDPSGDLLQAGPMLVTRGRRTALGEDPEGFSAGARQFDSDITEGRYPRAALAVAAERLFAVACDGRTRADAGMTLSELADALIDLGVTDALNLDGGGSASLVYGGRLRNRPREEHGVDLLEGRAVVTAIVFEQQ